MEEMEIQHMTGCKHDKSSGSSAARSAAKRENYSEQNESGSVRVQIINCSVDLGVIYLSHALTAVFHYFKGTFMVLAFSLCVQRLQVQQMKKNQQYKDIKATSYI